MKILITGINGFIGGNCAARLRRRLGASITGLDVQPTALALNCDEYVQLDIGSAGAAGALLKLPSFDYVLHAGGISGFMVETDNPQRVFEVNVMGTMRVLEMVRRMSCRRLVLCSTLMVYAPDPDVMLEHEETEYPEPISVYGGSKLAIEGLMHAFVAQYGVDAVALRFTHVYGPGRTTQCFIREMLSSAAAHRPCHISQASTSLRQYVHIEDVCQSIELAMLAPELRARVFNISADDVHTLAELAAVVQHLTGKLDVTFDEACDLPNYQIGKLSIHRAREILHYEPRVPLAEGVRKYWRSSFNEVSNMPMPS